jgi:hypothetical protein
MRARRPSNVPTMCNFGCPDCGGCDDHGDCDRDAEF